MPKLRDVYRRSGVREIGVIKTGTAKTQMASSQSLLDKLCEGA